MRSNRVPGHHHSTSFLVDFRKAVPRRKSLIEGQRRGKVLLLIKLWKSSFIRDYFVNDLKRYSAHSYIYMFTGEASLKEIKQELSWTRGEPKKRKSTPTRKSARLIRRQQLLLL